MAAGSSPFVIQVNEATFEKEVFQRSKEVPVVLDFMAGWCEPCQLLTPLLERLADEFQGQFILAKVDIDRNQGMAAELGVESIPFVIAFREGRIVSQFRGALPEEHIRAFLKEVLPSQAEVGIGQVRKILETAPSEALLLLDQIPVERNNRESISALRARCFFKLGRNAEAKAAAQEVTEGCDDFQMAANILAVLDFRMESEAFGKVQTCQATLAKQPKNAELHYQLGIALAAEERYPEALESLINAGERNPQLASGKAKDAMLRIFHLVGIDSELANDYRARLLNLLY
jgi:putative thioredoxin